eukprot:7241065-Prymnesium_polylepis.1
MKRPRIEHELLYRAFDGGLSKCLRLLAHKLAAANVEQRQATSVGVEGLDQRFGDPGGPWMPTGKAQGAKLIAFARNQNTKRREWTVSIRGAKRAGAHTGHLMPEVDNPQSGDVYGERLGQHMKALLHRDRAFHVFHGGKANVLHGQIRCCQPSRQEAKALCRRAAFGQVDSANRARML